MVMARWHNLHDDATRTCHRHSQERIRMTFPQRDVTLIILLVLAAPAAVMGQSSPSAASGWKTPWAYDGPLGPAHWGDLDSAYSTCKLGREQSPVDIRGAVKADLPPLQFDYHAGPLDHLVNNGYAIRVNYHGDEKPQVLRVGDETYRLVQFHFHRPSEEYVNGKAYPMVIHLMHQSSDGRLAGVAVLLKAGKPNPAVQAIWDHMPLTKGPEHDIVGVAIDPAGLLPVDRSYYTYAGSVSAPPCTEGVTWFVLETPVEVSPAQIRAFARVYPHDVRPLQPLNGRIVKRSH
jgi:carbonic anhydrase